MNNDRNAKGEKKTNDYYVYVVMVNGFYLYVITLFFFAFLSGLMTYNIISFENAHVPFSFLHGLHHQQPIGNQGEDMSEILFMMNRVKYRCT